MSDDGSSPRPVTDFRPSRQPGFTLSEEHKRKMALGRQRYRLERQERQERANERAAARQAAELTRGRPATMEGERPMPAELPREMTPEERAIQDVIDSGGTGLTRQSMASGADFDIPLKGRIRGWDYQYWPVKVMGQEVDPSTLVEYSRGGWLPVPASHFPQLCPLGSRATTIDRHGQRMYMRPMRLTEEAKAEMQRLAWEQKANRLAAAQAGDTGREFAARRNPDGSSAANISVEVKPLI